MLGTRSALPKADTTGGGAGKQQQLKEQDRRHEPRSGREGRLPPHLEGTKPYQQRKPVGLDRLSTPTADQSATINSKPWQGIPEQPHNGIADAYRQHTAPQLSQYPETQPQSGRDLGLKASTGSKSTIRDLLATHGIYLKSYAPAQYNALICPTCKGGSSSEESLSVKIEDDSQSATWLCHRGSCGSTGGCNLHSGGPSAPGITGEVIMSPRIHISAGHCLIILSCFSILPLGFGGPFRLSFADR